MLAGRVFLPSFGHPPPSGDQLAVYLASRYRKLQPNAAPSFLLIVSPLHMESSVYCNTQDDPLEEGEDMKAPGERHDARYVSYLRVSTQRQGESGLGIEAQRAAIARHLNGGDWVLLQEFVEIESGRKTARPVLAEALATCRALRCSLIVAKLDRLSRDAGLLHTLVNGKVPIVFCDLPEIPAGAVGSFVLQMMAALAELEARRTGERTKAALQAAKARGVQLGRTGPENIAAMNAARIETANRDAERVRTFVQGCMAQGMSKLATVRELNEAGIPAPRGGVWHPVQLDRVLARLEKLAPPPKRRAGRPRNSARA